MLSLARPRNDIVRLKLAPPHIKLNNYLEHHYNVEGIESRLFVQNIEAGILSMIKDRIDLGFD